ncbi:MAG: UvrD-helicase domain-containing protein [Thermoanaerobaculia bacterium]
MTQKDGRREGPAEASFEVLVQELVGTCSDWDENRELYVSEIIPQLQRGSTKPREGDLPLIERIRKVATEEQWESLPAIADQVANKPRLSAQDIAERRRQEREAQREVARELERERSAKAAALKAEDERRLQQHEKQLIAERELQLKRSAAAAALKENVEELKRERGAVARPLKEALKAVLGNSVAAADELNARIEHLELVDYRELKAAYLRQWIAEQLGEPKTSREQLDAIGDLAPSFLLKARAGSGKTSVVAQKTAFLVRHENIPPDAVMVLAFNEAAAREVRARVARDSGCPDYANARTFHSLAWQLVEPKSKPLFDEKTGNDQKQTEFLQELIDQAMTAELKERLYAFFRREMRELEAAGAFLSPEDYYLYRRNHEQETLRGEAVKSIGEKWLADFLFEHGLRYQYERIWYWSEEGHYRPDFTLLTRGQVPDVVIEHWGIDLKDGKRTVPDYWDQSWSDYRQLVDKKRDFWRNHNETKPDASVVLIETSVADMKDGREAFEASLKARLQNAGVAVVRQPLESLREALVRKRAFRFSKMVLQYIQKAKKQRLSPDAMADRIASATNTAPKTQAFLEIANSLYAAYQRELSRRQMIDFDDLLEAAIAVVARDHGRSRIKVQDERHIGLNDLQWIMVDEFQDFSTLFADLLAEIRKHNPAVRLFCVGDDWQAINGFAGANLRYFERFGETFAGARAGTLTNNYRSAPAIVELGNLFMSGKGDPSTPTQTSLAGKIEAVRCELVRIEQRSGDEYRRARESDTRFITYRDGGEGGRVIADPGMGMARVFKACHRILTQPRQDAKTTFAILSRVGRLGSYESMSAFGEKLRSTFTREELEIFGRFKERVRCGTAHSFKGLEADVTILLGVNRRTFPKIHPDNELYEIFGERMADILAEEERLFYVAITRAKSELYLLTETGRESEFLTRLNLAKEAGAKGSYGTFGDLVPEVKAETWGAAD